MSVWTGDVVPVRRSSRRLSVSGSDVESIPSGLTTPVKQTPRKLMHPKSSMIPRLKQIEEKMASSDDEIFVVPTSEQKRGRGRPRKDSPGRPKMTAIKTSASSVVAVKDAAAAVTPSLRKEKTPPRSRSSSRSRKTSSVPSSAPSTPSKNPTSVLNFDDSPVVTRRSTRIAGKTPAVNGHANGSSVQTAKTTHPSVGRFSTEQWRVQFTEKHPFFTKILIPAMICLVYAVIIIAVGAYFDVHKKAPIWMGMAAERVNDIYDDFWARRAAAAAANSASSAKSEI
ncbi:hypothetical protein PRIPAC_75392 [Pristionchus pacificus]|uniref:Uncharacterized protein n=1 Tax=Pristionchus pacificus TaxID=54126 RepID=A0A2A6BFA0_PRIPA|nr:hypothetical protein PRIPAC_75392 [Pristionchus pacificus]|eukprot:PDM64481.1 hypothetical protein PRIPAC_52737 [Pristionchus pacificus]